MLTNGFYEIGNHAITPSHFCPYTNFKDVIDSKNGENHRLDLSNRDQHWIDDRRVTQLKCLALAAATPIVHGIGLLLNLANCIAKIISFAHFWHSSLEIYPLSKRSWSLWQGSITSSFLTNHLHRSGIIGSLWARFT